MSHRLQVLIPEELDAQLGKAATRQRVSKGEWVRRVLVQAVQSMNSTADPVAELATIHAPTSDIDQMLREIDRGRLFLERS